MGLKEILDSGKYDREKVAEAAGISPAHLSNIANGRRTTNIDKAERIAEAVGWLVSPRDLIHRENTPSSSGSPPA